MAFGASAAWAAPASGETARPNIVFILIDDMGGSDLGCYGSSFYQTPQIDRLAVEGIRFTDAYAAAPVCSPTRASILTGQYPARLGLTDWLPGRRDMPSQKLLRPQIEPQLPLKTSSLPETLRRAGYVSASIGKWHLGGKGSEPQAHGFDLNIAGDHTGTPLSYFYPFRRQASVMPALEKGEEGEYLTDRLTAEAEKFMEQNRDKPFFLYLAHYAVHIPLHAKKELVEKYALSNVSGAQTNVIYAAMIESVDESVGRLLKKLDQLDLSRRTVVIFTSDNGGLSVKEGPNTPATSNLPLRGGKGALYEGGIRVPLIVRWPAEVRPGVCRMPVSSIDFYPTLVEIAGLPKETNQVIDGVSLMPLLKGGGTLERKEIFWHYPHYSNQGGKPGGAIRQENFKLIQDYEDGGWELYNLEEDPGEQRDLAQELPRKAQELGRKLDLWRHATEAQMPLPNPDFKAAASSDSKLILAAADGSLVLHARDASIHGATVRYEPEPHKNTIGYWTRLEDWVSWDFEISRPGKYEAEILQGCGNGSGGSEVAFSIDGQTLWMTVEETGGFQNFISRRIGRFQIDRSGRHTLAVKPKSKPGLAVMDLRQVILRPVVD